MMQLLLKKTLLKGHMAWLLCFLIPGAATQAMGSTNVVVSIISSRPLKDGLLCIGKYYGCVINYEDPAYYDDETRLQESAPGRGYFYPRVRALEFQFNATNSLRAAVDAALKANAAVDPGVVYEVVTNAVECGGLSILPREWRGKGGTVVRSRRILEKKIMFRLDGGETPMVAMSRLTEELLRGNPYESEILFNGVPDQGKAGPQLSVTNGSALAVLNRLVCMAGGKHSAGNWCFIRQPMFKGKKKSRLVIRSVENVRGKKPDRFAVCHTARPLANALAIVAADLGEGIGYEGPELNNSGVITGMDGKPYCPVGARLSFEYSSAWSADQVLLAMLSNFHLGGYTFESVKAGDGLCVLPARKLVDLRRRRYAPCSAVSSTKIHVAATVNNGRNMLDDICRQLSKSTGKTVVLGEIPEGLGGLAAKQGEAELPGWRVLSTYLGSLRPSLCWTLLYDPNAAKYVLRVADTGR